jgi:hypothetical protein
MKGGFEVRLRALVDNSPWLLHTAGILLVLPNTPGGAVYFLAFSFINVIKFRAVANRNRSEFHAFNRKGDYLDFRFFRVSTNITMVRTEMITAVEARIKPQPWTGKMPNTSEASATTNVTGMPV